MKPRLYTLLSLSTVFLFGACDKEEEALPCLQVEVVEEASCGTGTILLVSTGDAQVPPPGFCGTPTGSSRYVVVDNVPADLQAPGTIFTCQLEEREADTGPCLAIYRYYEEYATIAGICKAPEPAPVN